MQGVFFAVNSWLLPKLPKLTRKTTQQPVRARLITNRDELSYADDA